MVRTWKNHLDTAARVLSGVGMGYSVLEGHAAGKGIIAPALESLGISNLPYIGHNVLEYMGKPQNDLPYSVASGVLSFLPGLYYRSKRSSISDYFKHQLSLANEHPTLAVLGSHTASTIMSALILHKLLENRPKEKKAYVLPLAKNYLREFAYPGFIHTAPTVTAINMVKKLHPFGKSHERQTEGYLKDVTLE